VQAAHLIISLPIIGLLSGYIIAKRTENVLLRRLGCRALHRAQPNCNSLWETLKFVCFGSPRALHVTAALRVTGRLHVTAPLHVTGSPAVVHWRTTPHPTTVASVASVASNATRATPRENAWRIRLHGASPALI
jgi:hypothetical protein